MKIGLIDVDYHNYPNLALMKLSAYHKGKGDDVEWVNPLFGDYDIIYQAKVFTFTKDDNSIYKTKKLVKGGTGYDLSSKLPDEVEHTFPDYSLYDIKNTAYGYLSRGCPRGCPFCIVAQKEGKCSQKVANLSEWWNGQNNIKLLDPNITACADFPELMQQLIDSKAWVDFSQGLDIRLMTDEKLDLLNRVKTKMIHFAWDNPDDKITPKMLEKYVDKISGTYRKKRVYILTNFNSTHEQDLMRVYKLRDMGYDPYIMIYQKWAAPKITHKLQRWVNNKFIFRTVEVFGDYKGGKK